jgi:enoyl-CoA hydratase
VTGGAAQLCAADTLTTMSDVVSYELEDGIATVRLANGKVNAISPDVIDALNAALDRSEADGAIVVLTGSPGILSAGYDLKVMQAGPDSAIALVSAGSTLSRRMLAHPLPVIIACPGHAVAKGAFLLLSADYRVGVEGPFKIGLNEVQIGMTMHHAGIELARDRLRKSYLNRSVINAEMFDPQEALAAGFLDAVVAPDDLMPTALAVANGMKNLNMTAHARTKVKLRAQVLESLDLAIEADKLNALW